MNSTGFYTLLKHYQDKVDMDTMRQLVTQGTVYAQEYKYDDTTWQPT